MCISQGKPDGALGINRLNSVCVLTLTHCRSRVQVCEVCVSTHLMVTPPLQVQGTFQSNCHGMNQQSRPLYSCGLFFSKHELLCHQSRGQDKVFLSISHISVYLSSTYLSPIFPLFYLFDSTFILGVITPLKIKKGILEMTIFFLLSIIELVYHINIILKHLQKFCFLLTKISICNASQQFKHLCDLQIYFLVQQNVVTPNN